LSAYNDGSKYLKFDQIVEVYDATVTAPQLSGAVFRWNLQLADSPNRKIVAQHQRCIQLQIYNVQRQLTAKQRNGCKLDDLFGALTSLFEKARLA
jgi:hypothetical protein